MDKSKIVKISGTILIPVLVIVGVSWSTTGGLFQGKIFSEDDDTTLEGGFPIAEENTELEGFQERIANEQEYLNSECTQLKYKLQILNNELTDLYDKQNEYFVQREQEYLKIKSEYEPLKSEYDKIYDNEYLPLKKGNDEYIAEYNKQKAELGKIAKKYGVTIEELLYNYLDYPWSVQVNIKDIVEKMNTASIEGTKLANDSKPIVKKLENLKIQIDPLLIKYKKYTDLIIQIEKDILKKQGEIDSIQDEIDQKCPSQSAPKDVDNPRSGDRGGKKSEQDASERWSQEIDSQTWEIEQLVIPEAFEFEFSEEFVIDENAGRNSERVTR